MYHKLLVSKIWVQLILKVLPVMFSISQEGIFSVADRSVKFLIL